MKIWASIWTSFNLSVILLNRPPQRMKQTQQKDVVRWKVRFNVLSSSSLCAQAAMITAEPSNTQSTDCASQAASYFCPLFRSVPLLLALWPLSIQDPNIELSNGSDKGSFSWPTASEPENHWNHFTMASVQWKFDLLGGGYSVYFWCSVQTFGGVGSLSIDNLNFRSRLWGEVISIFTTIKRFRVSKI